MKLVMMADPRLTNVKHITNCFRVKLLLTFSQVEGRSSRPDDYAETDISSYYDIWNAALRLLELCLAHFNIPGLITVGKDTEGVLKELCQPQFLCAAEKLIAICR